MDLNEATSIYEALRPKYETYAEKMYMFLKERLEKLAIGVTYLHWRAKTVESFRNKAEKDAYPDPLNDMVDLAGIRIIVPYEDIIQRIWTFIHDEFDVDPKNSYDRQFSLGPDSFGYRSVHLVVRIKPSRPDASDWTEYVGLKAEIQVRSLLQDAWASVSHELDYKAAGHAPKELRRRLFRMAALLELGDQEFVSLRNNKAEVVLSYRTRIERGDLAIPLNRSSLMEFLAIMGNLDYWEKRGIAAGMEKPTEAIQTGPDPNNREVDRLLETLTTLHVEDLHSAASVFQQLEKVPLTSMSRS